MTVRGPFAIILAILLVVSLAANFIVLGFAAAQYGTRGSGGDAASIERIVTLGARAFPRDLRRQIKQELDSHRGEMRTAVRDLGSARRDMFRIMAAEQLDQQALSAAFIEVREKTDELQRLGQELIADVLEDASPESRAKIRPPRRRR